MEDIREVGPLTEKEVEQRYSHIENLKNRSVVMNADFLILALTRFLKHETEEFDDETKTGLDADFDKTGAPF